MSIKIIKNTMVEPIETTCPVCQSIFSFNYEDIQREETGTFLGVKTVNRYVVCPVCKSTVNMSAKVLIEESKRET